MVSLKENRRAHWRLFPLSFAMQSGVSNAPETAIGRICPPFQIVPRSLPLRLHDVHARFDFGAEQANLGRNRRGSRMPSSRTASRIGGRVRAPK